MRNCAPSLVQPSGKQRGVQCYVRTRCCMARAVRFTAADLEWLPDDGKRYEIIGGELHVSKQPSWTHQAVCSRILVALHHWSLAGNSGQAAVAPGLVLGDEDDVVPDVVWVSASRLNAALDAAGHLRAAPDL